MDYLLKSSALLLLMHLGYTLFLKKETFFSHNRWFLFFGIVIASLLPLVEIPVYIPVETTVNTNIPFELVYTPTEIIQNETFDWLQLLSYIYIIGVVIFLAQFIFQFGSLLVLLVKNSKNKDGIYTYVVVKSKISPFSFFKWIVYNPNLFSEDELQLILNHEKVHVRQWHSLDIIISRLACVAFWFNPLAWLYHKSIQQNLEYIADAETQRISESSAEYQQLLLKTSIGNANINLTSNFYNSLIKKRIVMLQKHQSKSINRWKSFLVLPFFFIFLMSFNTKEVFVEAPTKTNESEVIDTKVEVVFTNKMSDESLDKMKENLKKESVEMTLKSLKRNSEGLINKIDISFEYDGSSTSYKADTKEGIKPFRFVKFENGMVMVGPANMEVIEVIEEPEVEEIIEIIEEPVIEIIEDKEEEIEIEADSVYFIKTKPKAKARYVFRTKDSIVAGKPKTAYTFKSNGNVKFSSNSFTIKADSINYKNTFRIRNSKGKDPIYIINGKVASKKDLKKMNPNKISEVNVIKGDKATALYGKKGKDGVVEIKTKGKASKKKNAWQISKVEATDVFKTSTKAELNKFLSTNKKPLIVINGDILGKIDVKDLDYSIIESISIVDDKTATEIYGAKGENGIVVITTNEAKNRFERLRNSNEDYKVQINSVRFEDDNKDSKMVLHYITKDTQDKLMDTHKKELAKKGITVKYSKLKRNKNGEIVRIKISVKDKDGNSSVGTFNNTNGIPTVNFGKYGDDLVVSSNPL
ncbi:M56 family metallopeptidase [Winogradskyella jejuensis]|uniref:Signal transducer regulating beta-lactamase production, contains metallopeptidase domain n=1 Tax=Winogradskyella jejuensis TaxID=1089305 RepID=A0A1M5S1D4_9FLAO|nr:M56 family metallopeptidase [Winogradskyella jejuensis]SHH32286.1 Signal transducer regulating beta-lactamase production, contains metallopeptidase domain [Winogradskyella jejuensis]